MCGRVKLSIEDVEELEKIIRNVEKNNYEYVDGEIYPSDKLALLKQERGQVKAVSMTWGFHGFKKGQLIINARSETVNEKRMFAESFKLRRCVFPTSGFYEWDVYKRKYLFRLSNDPALYLGGLFKQFSDGMRCVILTTSANDSVLDTHDRMPVILKRGQIRQWLRNYEYANDLIRQTMPLMERMVIAV